MKDKTYTVEITEQDIRDIASNRASRKTFKRGKYIAIPFIPLLLAVVTVSSIENLEYLQPFFFILGAIASFLLLAGFYASMLYFEPKYRKQLFKELTSEL